MKLAIIPCVHGIEPYGMEVVKRLPAIPFFIGNPLALERKVVFVESNLNRSFPGKENGTYEEKLAYELKNKLKDFDYVIDLHSSSNKCPIFGIISKSNNEKIEFAKKLGLKRLVIMSQDFEDNNALIDWVKCGLSLEVGPHERKENVDDAVELIKNFLNNKNKNENIEIFEIFNIVKKQTENIIIENFQHIKKGDLIAFDENIKQYAEFDFTGILVDEKSYGDVLCLAAKRIS
jgi:succinylglutamate desuccinylase